MIFSKKYKYRSITKKKTNKFFFFFHFFSFLFESSFFFLIFQKKTNLFDFNIERNELSKKGFILKKTSSTFLRHLLKKYKPFFKGFVNLAFDFHFICYSKKKDLTKAKQLVELFDKKEMKEKYQILLFNYKGRFYTYKLIEDKIFKYLNLKTYENMLFFNNIKLYFQKIKNIHFLIYSKKLKLK